jgi:hypothetical protein
MKWLSYAPLAVLLLAAAAAVAQDKPKESPWYPLQVGNTWTYKDSSGGRFTLKVTRHEKIDKVNAAHIELSGADGKALLSEDVGVADDGVYRYKIGDQKPDKPVLFFKLPPKKGETWKVDTKVMGQPLTGTFKIDEAEIKIGDKTYKTFTSSSDDLDIAGLKWNVTFYFAENVGLVKQVLKVNGQEVSLELEKFEPGKK